MAFSALPTGLTALKRRRTEYAGSGNRLELFHKIRAGGAKRYPAEDQQLYPGGQNPGRGLP